MLLYCIPKSLSNINLLITIHLNTLVVKEKVQNLKNFIIDLLECISNKVSKTPLIELLKVIMC